MLRKTILTALTAAFVSTGFSSGVADAHGPDGHHRPAPPRHVSKAKAKAIATARVARLVKKEKLEKSWAKVAPTSAEKKDNKGRTEWVVFFENEKASDAEKSKLYVFLTLSGDYIAANHTGK